MAEPKQVKAIKGGLDIAKRLLADGEELTAAQRAEAGKKAAELIKSQPPTKASEALGQLMEKGVKKTTTTQADRTRVGGGNIGGAPFSAISEADPAYKGKVWGVMDEGTAARLKNLATPDTAFTTMLGSANQLKTNPIVFDKLKRGFVNSMKEGNLSDELAGKINHNLALTFGEGADIRDPKIWRQADTFEKRAALADVMMGQGIAPSKGGLALGGEKSGKGVIFKPTDILKRETEPSLLHTEHGGDVPTFAAGPRLFRIDKESEYRPDLHPGFPTLLKGEDYGINMIPTPTEVYLPEFHKKFKKDNPDRKAPGYYDLALGVKGEGLPSQELNDEYIRHLLREGYAKGGAVDIDAADRRLSKAMEERMAEGGKVDLKAADARLEAAMNARMADGGEVGFKKIQFMEKGGKAKLASGIANIGKRLMADSDVLPTAEREANLAKMLSESKVKNRLYHGTTKDIKKFDQSQAGKKTGNLTTALGTFLSDSPKEASRYAKDWGAEGGNVMPVFAQLKNPYEMPYKEFDNLAMGAWNRRINDPDYDPNSVVKVGDMEAQRRAAEAISKHEAEALQDVMNRREELMSQGYDSIMVKIGGNNEIIVFDPTKIKSATGNRGTYDINEADITKAEGGGAFKKLEFMQAGGTPKGKAGRIVKGGKAFMNLFADPAESSVASARRGESMVGNTITKDVGGNWIPAGNGYENNLENQLNALKKGRHDAKSDTIKQMMAMAQAEGDTGRVSQLQRSLQEAIGREAANKWVDSNLRNYVTKQMATEKDPVRKLAEQGITAFPKLDDGDGGVSLKSNSFEVRRRREMTGYPEKGVSESPLARHYETLADEAIHPSRAETYQKLQALPSFQRPRSMADMPWINKLDPDEKVYQLSQDANFERMGFSHIMDVLREDVAAGRIRPEQLNKISMEDAVKRAHQYDEELKAKMLNARIAEQANANVFKEYPEGYKWVQLDKPGQFSLESDIMGHSVRGYEPKKGHADYTDISGDSGYDDYGHGGYDAIKSGDAKIYSLRDPKGMSHATVEVGPQNHLDFNKWWDSQPKELRDEINARARRGEHGGSIYESPEYLAERRALPSRITQIKGKQNAAPNEEYLPYIQDLVKSGKWSEVKDIQNTGLMDVEKMTDPTTYAKYLENKLQVPKYATERELEELHNEYLRLAEPRNYKPSEDGMAEGGGAFKSIPWNKFQRFDGGGIAVDLSEPSEDARREPLMTKKDLERLYANAKRNAPAQYEIAKQAIKDEASQLKSAGGVKDFALRVGAQALGGIPDLINLGLMGVDYGMSTANHPVNLSSENPWFGSQQYIDAMHKAGMLGESEFPISETVAGILAPVGLIKKVGKKGYQAVKGAKPEAPKKRRGGLAAMSR